MNCFDLQSTIIRKCGINYDRRCVALGDYSNRINPITDVLFAKFTKKTSQIIINLLKLADKRMILLNE